MINLKEIGILVNFFVDTLQRLIFFARNNKKTTLAWYFIKVTARLTFTQLRVISSLNMKIENMLQRFSCSSFLFKPPCNDQFLSGIIKVEDLLDIDILTIEITIRKKRS